MPPPAKAQPVPGAHEDSSFPSGQEFSGEKWSHLPVCYSLKSLGK